MVYPRDKNLGVLMTHWTKDSVDEVNFFWNPKKLMNADWKFRKGGYMSPNDLYTYGNPVGPTELCKWND